MATSKNKTFLIYITCSIICFGCLKLDAEEEWEHPITKKIREHGPYTTESMEPVDFTVIHGHGKPKKVFLQIPKAYLIHSELWKGGEQEIVGINTRLPDLAPRDQGRPRFKPRQEGYEEWLHRHQEYSDDEYNITFSIHLDASDEANKTQLDKWEEHFKKRYEIQKNQVSGLDHYVKNKCTEQSRYTPKKLKKLKQQRPDHFIRGSKICTLQRDYFLVPQDHSGPWVHFSCVIERENSYSGCTGRSWHGHVSYSFSFNRTQLDRWQEYEEGARKLIDIFYAGTSE